MEALRAVGGSVEAPDEDGIASALGRLAERDITSLLLEGGATIHRAVWDAGVVDRVLRFIAPVDLGDEGVAWLEDGSFEALRDVRDRPARSGSSD